MAGKGLMYAATFAGLYLELFGAFLLAAEAIGKEHLLRVAGLLRKRRVVGFVVMLAVIFVIVAVSRLMRVIHFTEVIVMVFSLGLLYDFAPAAITILVRRFGTGTAGILGFGLFVLQAYVSLSLLY
jgi:hypothetical protein